MKEQNYAQTWFDPFTLYLRLGTLYLLLFGCVNVFSQPPLPGLPPGTGYVRQGNGPPPPGGLVNPTTRPNMAVSPAVVASNQAGPVIVMGPLVQQASMTVDFLQKKLEDPGIIPEQRKILESQLEQAKLRLADAKTNTELWSEYISAIQASDSERQSQSEARLSRYLAERLGRIQGKTYPTNMTLAAIGEEYKIASGGSNFDRRRIVLVILSITTIVPLIFMGYWFFRSRSTS
jgi:hypothetical protein